MPDVQHIMTSHGYSREGEINMHSTLQLVIALICAAMWSATSPLAALERNVFPVEVVSPARHVSAIGALHISPNGRYLASTSQDKTVNLWDFDSARLIRSFKGHLDNVWEAAFSPDGNLLATCSYDKTVRLWELATGKLIRTYTGHTADIRGVAFSPDGKSIASGSEDKTIRVWDVNSGALKKVFKLPEEVGEIAYISNGTRLIAAGIEKASWMVDAESGKVVDTYKDSSSGIGSLSLAPDGKSFALSVGGSFKIWRVGETKSTKTIRGHGQRDELTSGAASVTALSFAPDGRSIASAGSDGTIKIWDSVSGQLLRTIKEGSTNGATGLAFASDGRAIVSGNLDGAITYWDVATGQVLKKIEPANPYNSVLFTPNGLTLATQDSDQVVRLWDVASGRLLQSLPAQRRDDFSSGLSMLFSADQSMLYTISTRTDLQAWETTSGRLMRTVKIPELGTLDAFKASPDGKAILIGSQIRDLTTGRVTKKLPVTGSVYSAVYTSDGRTLILGGEAGGAGAASDMKVSMIDSQTGKTIRTLLGHRSLPAVGEPGVAAVRTLVISPDTLTLASGANDNKIGMWELATGRRIRVISGHRGAVNAVAFSLNGRLIASGSDDQTVRLWDSGSGQLIHNLVGHAAEITAVNFLNDRVFSSMSKDLVLKFWDISSGELLGTRVLVGHSWVTVTAEGFFDFGGNGASMLNVVRGLEFYSMDQFRDALYRPDLVKAKLAGDPNGVVKAAAAKLDLNKAVESGNAPKVAITSPGDGSGGASGREVNVEASVTDQGGGVGRIEWRLNGQTLGVETRGFRRVQDNLAPSTSTPGSAGSTIRVSQQVVLDAGDNIIEVLAYNIKGLVSSQPARITLKATGPVAVAKPRLFVLAVGVNDYYDSRLKLNFAVPDARSIAASFKKAGSGFYESVKAVTVLDGDVTKANLEKVFAQLATEVKSSDVFVFFIAGHGRTLDGRYYFLPQDFKYKDQRSYAENGLSQEQWQKWITLVQAKKSILIYDTCESGSVTADSIVVASNTRGLERVEEQAVAYDKLRDATGRTILAASTDTQPALEGYNGHGVFSYIVIEALEKAQPNSNGLIEVTGLISYVDEKVPDVSYKAFKQRQIPQNKLTGSNFAIVKPTAMLLTNTGPESNATAKAPGGAPATSTSDPATAAAKPTHVVIAPADVYEQLGGTGAKIQQLAPGTLLSLVKTDQGWMLVAKDGKSVGYVAAETLLRVQ